MPVYLMTWGVHSLKYAWSVEELYKRHVNEAASSLCSVEGVASFGNYSQWLPTTNEDEPEHFFRLYSNIGYMVIIIATW